MVEAWTDFAIARRLSPGKDHTGILHVFCQEAGVDPQMAEAVLNDWLQWCHHSKWTRLGVN